MSKRSRTITALGLLICAVSACPCAWGLFQIPSVVLYAQETGRNVALQVFVPVVLAAIINTFGLVTIFVSLVVGHRASA